MFLNLLLAIPIVTSLGNRITLSDDVLKILAAQNNVTVYETCSYFSDDCFVVKNFVSFRNGQLSARRHLKPKMNMLGSITIARLRVPSPLSGPNLLVRNWKIDKRTIDGSFPTGELYVAIGYITEALSYESRVKQSVLMIGLGGGVISNYLSTLPNIETTAVELDPAIVTLAQHFFDHQEVGGVLKTFTDDGVKFLDKAVKQGLKYRVVMIDADYNGDTTGTGLIGPVKEFLEQKTIWNICQALEDGGTVAVNVVSVHSRTEREREAIQAYQKYFPSCYYVPFLTVRNNPEDSPPDQAFLTEKVKKLRECSLADEAWLSRARETAWISINQKLLICSKRTNWTLEERKRLFTNNLKTAIQKLGFKELEYEIDF